MTSVDPLVEQRFAEILAGTRAKAAAITESVEAKRQEIAEESQRMRGQNEQLCKQLDERSEAKAAAKEDPTARNEWLKRNSPQDSTFNFGEAEEQAPPPAPPVVPETTERTPAPGRPRHSRRDEFDEDDFSNNSWLK
ncbi:hypothetical protein [Amycolatopsis sp.]|uniref:hypothetical protein n=1 Tax=Amycolatopsis sp. TaxID=37632 RepID=UPI002D0A4719|nr:hypothetical protein [Amycolatopsis sp.]HVV14251.1 hypothetical protein [Amycolatopsis sp.]